MDKRRGPLDKLGLEIGRTTLSGMIQLIRLDANWTINVIPCPV